MGALVIKKEDLKGDVTIEFDNNIVYDMNSGEVPLISFIDGELKIKIKNQIIANKEVVKSINLTEAYKNKFRINGLKIPMTNYIEIIAKERKVMRKYKCINEMMIEVVDGDGAIIDNKYNFIAKGSVWELDDSDFRVCDGEVRLLNFEDDRYSWIEMPYEDLEKHFEELL